MRKTHEKICRRHRRLGTQLSQRPVDMHLLTNCNGSNSTLEERGELEDGTRTVLYLNLPVQQVQQRHNLVTLVSAPYIAQNQITAHP